MTYIPTDLAKALNQMTDEITHIRNNQIYRINKSQATKLADFIATKVSEIYKYVEAMPIKEQPDS